jgi:hypothetical protein
MTIAIAIAVPDGIALAADTQTTWSQTVDHAKEKGTGKDVALESPILVPVGWSRMARKLFPLTLSGTTFGLATAGAALINKKTPYSILKHLEASYAGPSDFDSVLAYLLEGLKDQLRKHHGITDLTKAPTLAIDVILAGFNDKDVSQPRLGSYLVYSGTPTIAGVTAHTSDFRHWVNEGANRLGGCWIGRTEFVSHIVNHKNPELPPISGQFELMTLADAVDYTTFLARFTCDFQRFAVMVPDVGRPIMSATLTPDGYTQNILDA